MHQAPARGLIECSERFIEKQHLGIKDQSPRQARALRLFSGEHSDWTVGKVGDIELLKHRLNLLFALGSADAPQSEPKPDIMSHSTSQRAAVPENTAAIWR